MLPEQRFTIRVYGLLINEKEEILLSDEYVFSTYMTKFPGGGLEYGEGTIDCLKREFREELAIEVTDIRHFYTTDFFQATAFYKNTQVISIYYLVSTSQWDQINISTKRFDFPEKEGSQSFRLVPIIQLNRDDLTFPIDQKVLQLLKQHIH